MNLRDLSQFAFEHLIETLERNGTEPGELQRATLYELIDTMTEYAIGKTRGRKVFALAAGSGKTTAIISWIATLHRLGNDDIAVSVSASKVEALCEIKRKLMEHGVPEDLIGLKHSLGAAASLPSTDNQDRRYQLVTHARVRSERDHELFIRHKGTPRKVMIYDEALLRADTADVPELALSAAFASFREQAGRLGQRYEGVINYLSACLATIRANIDRLKRESEAADPVINLGELSSIEQEDYVALVEGLRPLNGGNFDVLTKLLEISQQPVRIVSGGQHPGIVWFRTAIPDELKNVIVLDASHPIRNLAALDHTIEHIDSFNGMDVKTYENVQVLQMLVPGGRYSVTQSFKGKTFAERRYSRDVVEVVKSEAAASGILLFTYKDRDVPIGRTLLDDLRNAGVDIEAKTAEGRKRINLLTWGDETSLNGYEHCDAVIMVGVLHREPLDLAASIIGQSGDLARPVEASEIKAAEQGEICHLIYQAASRGACRLTDQNKARPMKLYLMHRNAEVRYELAKVMPGVQWSIWEPRFVPRTSESQEQKLALAILEYLEGLPGHINEVSTTGMKKDLNLTDPKLKRTFSRAVSTVDQSPNGWTLDGRSFRRTASLFSETTD